MGKKKRGNPVQIRCGGVLEGFAFSGFFLRKGKMGTEQSVRENEIGQKSGVFNGLERFPSEVSYTK